MERWKTGKNTWWSIGFQKCLSNVQRLKPDDHTRTSAKVLPRQPGIWSLKNMTSVDQSWLVTHMKIRDRTLRALFSLCQSFFLGLTTIFFPLCVWREKYVYRLGPQPIPARLSGRVLCNGLRLYSISQDLVYSFLLDDKINLNFKAEATCTNRGEKHIWKPLFIHQEDTSKHTVQNNILNMDFMFSPLFL